MITKICGIKNKETLLCCEKKGVNFFGMIFYKKVQEIFQGIMQFNFKNYLKI